MGLDPRTRTLARCLAVLVLLHGADASARDWWIDCENGDDVLGDGTSALPFQSVQLGINSATSGDVVRVVAGVCTGPGQGFPIDMRPGISLFGAGDYSTYIANLGYSAGVSAVEFAYTPRSITQIPFPNTQEIADLNIETLTDGITLLNGSPTINNNVIHYGTNAINLLTAYDVVTLGPGAEANPIIEQNEFYENTRGIRIQANNAGVSPVVRENLFLGPGDSGMNALQLRAIIPLAPLLENNVIANYRVGMGIFGGTPSLRHNTIADNGTGIATYSSAYRTTLTQVSNNLFAYNYFGVDEIGPDAYSVEVANNDFWANVGGDWMDVALGPLADVNALPLAVGNFSAAPHFVNAGADDYHCWPSSGARDRGLLAAAPARDIDGQARSDGQPDVGADEVYLNTVLAEPRITGAAVVTDLCPGMQPPGSDGDVDPGEVIDVTLMVTNLSPFATATNLRAAIVADGPEVTPPSAEVTFGTVGPLQTASSTTPYTFRYQPIVVSPCPDKIRFFVDFDSDETGPLSRRAFEIKVGTLNGCQICTSPVRPAVALRNSVLRDTCANGSPPGLNLMIEPGEHGELLLTVENTSSVRASGVSASLATTAPGVTPASGVVAFGNVAAGASVAASAPFAFDVSSSQVSCGQTLPFDVTVSWLELPPTAPTVSPLNLNVPASCANCASVLPAFTLWNQSLVDVCNSGSSSAGNGLIDRGELIDLSVVVSNTSPDAGATNVTGRLLTTSPDIVPVEMPLQFGDVGPGATQAALTPARFRVATTALCGASLPFELELSSVETGVVSPRLAFNLQIAPTPCGLCNDSPVVLVVAAPSISDSCQTGAPGGDGDVNPGESFGLTLSVTNNSPHSAASDVTATVTFDVPWLVPSTGSTSFGTVAPLQSKLALAPMMFKVGPSGDLCGSIVTVSVVFASPEVGTLPAQQVVIPLSCPTCSLPFPDLVATTTTVTDRCPWGGTGGDGKLDAGEIADVLVQITNQSPSGAATGVSATFAATIPGFEPDLLTISGPDIPPGATLPLDVFSFVTEPTAPCGTYVEYEVFLSSYETGVLPPFLVSAVLDPVCQICQPDARPLYLYRRTVASVAAGWKAIVPLPLTSASAPIDAGWPRVVSLPGTQDDSGILADTSPLLLYRILDDLDDYQGNVLRLVKAAGTDIRATF